MLSVLFLAARMRAIQLTQGETEKFEMPQPSLLQLGQEPKLQVCESNGDLELHFNDQKLLADLESRMTPGARAAIRTVLDGLEGSRRSRLRAGCSRRRSGTTAAATSIASLTAPTTRTRTRPLSSRTATRSARRRSRPGATPPSATKMEKHERCS